MNESNNQPVLDLFVNEIMEKVNDEQIDPTKRKALITLIDRIKEYITEHPDIMTSKQKLEHLLEIIVSGFRHSGYNTSESIIQSFPITIGKLDELIEGINEEVSAAGDSSKDSTTPINVQGQVPQDQQLEIKTVENTPASVAQPNAPIQKDDNVKVKHSPANVKFEQLLKEYPALQSIPHKDKEGVRKRIIKAVKRSKRTGEDVLDAYRAIVNRYKSIKWGKLEELTQELTKGNIEATPQPAPPEVDNENENENNTDPNDQLINAAAAIKYINMMNLYNHLDPTVRPPKPEDVLNDEKYKTMLKNNQEVIDKEKIQQVINERPDIYAQFLNRVRRQFNNNPSINRLNKYSINDLITMIPFINNNNMAQAIATVLNMKLHDKNIRIYQNLDNKNSPMGTIPEIYNTAIKFINNVLGTTHPILNSSDKIAFNGDLNKRNLQNHNYKPYIAKIYFKKGEPKPSTYTPPNVPTSQLKIPKLKINKR